MALKQGPLTRDEIMSVWAAACDKSYRDPLLDAGDGQGLEVYSQAAEQLARVSRAIDSTTQSLYILPWSGQTDVPASGEIKATVTLTITRTALLSKTLVLGAGRFFVEEEQTDATPNGPLQVFPGRVYVLQSDLVFPAGEQGPFTVVAEAVQPGAGYNNPRPDTITSTSTVQNGSGFNNTLATVIAANLATATPGSPARAIIQSKNKADTFVPDHIGQYVYFVDGANQGKVARIVSFDAAPDPVAKIGSVVSIALDFTVDATTFAGVFQAGEQVTFSSGAVGQVLGTVARGGVLKLAYRLLSGSSPANIGDTATGVLSSATLTVRTCFDDGLYTAEAPSGSVGGASWRVLDWAAGFGISVTHDASPEGGALGVLDEIGRERDLSRAPGEPDTLYRQRVATLADVVSPNAIMRALSRTLGALPWCFREVGYPELRGWFYDGDLGPAGAFSNTDAAIAALDDAYDTDVILFTGTVTSGAFLNTPGTAEHVVLEDAKNNVSVYGFFGSLTGGSTLLTVIRKNGEPPASLTGLHVRGLESGAIFTPTSFSIPNSVEDRRFRLVFDYTEFRAFFLVGLPRLGFGDPGYAYDKGVSDAYDAVPYDAFYDGQPFGTADVYRRVYHAVDQARAGGVGFDLYIEDIGCP